MSTTKMQLLAEELLTRSKAGDIGWHRSSHESAYLLHFPDLFLIIRQRNDGDYELEVGDESRGGSRPLLPRKATICTLGWLRSILQPIPASGKPA